MNGDYEILVTSIRYSICTMLLRFFKGIVLTVFRHS